MQSSDYQYVKFSKPGYYSIKVLGNVKSELWEYFEGETDQVLTNEPGKVTTVLRIYVKDQAELSGLLNMLYKWRLVLLSVNIEVFPEEKP